MKRSIIPIQKMILVCPILYILWGCAPLQPRVVQLPAQKSPQSVKVLKSDFEGKEISKAEVMLGLKAIFTQTGDRGEQITWTSDRGPSGEFSQNVRGVKIDASMNKMIVTYYNGSKFTSYTYRRPSVDYTTTDIIAELPVNVADDGTNYVITIAYPGTLTVAPQRNMGFVQEQYADTGHVAQDLGAKIEAVKGLSIKRNVEIEGKVAATIISCRTRCKRQAASTGAICLSSFKHHSTRDLPRRGRSAPARKVLISEHTIRARTAAFIATPIRIKTGRVRPLCGTIQCGMRWENR